MRVRRIALPEAAGLDTGGLRRNGTMHRLRTLILALAASLATMGAVQAQDAGLPAVGGAGDLGQLITDSQEPVLCDPASLGMCVEEIVITGSRVRPPNITNVQEAEVDEGDLVKIRGDILVILRRGRLFTVSTAGGRLRPIDRIDAYPPGVDAEDDWYDEMLVSDGRVIVIGYSYERGGTEINRFHMDRDGRLTFEDSHHIRSNDYYSSRNYASRLIGSRLVLYAPLYLRRDADPLEQVPRLSRWRGPDQKTEVRALVAPDDVHVSPRYRDAETVRALDALHTVVSCDVASTPLDCRATAVLGPGGRSFYVSPSAVYLWLTEWRWTRRAATRGSEPDSALYRIPLDGARPTAIRTRGAPIDQFSFSEDAEQGLLNVLLVSASNGDAMWAPESAGGGAALLRLPLSRLGDGAGVAPDEDYRVLPSMWSRTVNRFVGDHLAYASSDWNDDDETWEAVLNVTPVEGGTTFTLLVDGVIGRVEALGEDVLAVVSKEDEDGDWARTRFLTVELAGGTPALTDTLEMAGAREAEARSHAFMFNPDLDSPDGRAGILGLPVVRYMPETDGEEPLFYETADMAYLRRREGRLSQAGLLASRPAAAQDDGCVVSCVDWYGNARPIFIGGRVFALLGYELVEGQVRGDRIREIRRVSFAPPPAPSVRY